MKQIHKTINRLGVALLLASLTAISARADYQATVLSQNPAGYWRLNQTVQPSPASFATNSGTLLSAANGYYTNLPALNLSGPFTGSAAVGLDGTSQLINTPYVASLNTSAFSFEVWAQPAQIGGNVAYLASSVHIASPRSGWYLAQDNGGTFNAGNAFVVRMFNQNTTTPTTQLAAPITNSVGSWIHLVLTYDGSVASLYENGVLITNHAAAYIANVDSPFTVGARSDLGLFWPGSVAESAVYGGALTATQVAAHYAAATSQAAYSAAVLADAPLLYQTYAAPPQSPAANLGSLGSAGNGIYLAPTRAGVSGPMPPAYPGFDGGNVAAAFNGNGAAVQLPKFNFNTNTVTFSAWVSATNLQSKGAGIVISDSGSTIAGLTADDTTANGSLGLGYVWNGDPATSQWSPTGAGLPLLPNSSWAYVALVVEPTQAEIYIATTNTDGSISFNSATNHFFHVNQAFSGPTLIGSDQGKSTLTFKGAIDEVAVWNRSLSSGELYSQFASAIGGVAPFIFSGPTAASTSVFTGDTLTLSVNAGGTPNLSYQWYHGASLIPLATTNVYVKSSITSADAGSYYVVVSSTLGTATSGSVSINVLNQSAPTVTYVSPSATIYPGGSLNLSVVATGGGLAYQWSTNGTPIPNATNSFYSVASVTAANAGSYTVTVTNILGTFNNNGTPAVITVPTLVTGTYAQIVDADAPISWWRLDDLAVTNGAILADVMGRHYGTYTNNGGLTSGNPGALTGPLAGTSLAFSGDGSYGYVPYFPDLSDLNFSLELWAYQTNVVNNVTAASSWDDSNNGYAIGAVSYWQGTDAAGNFGGPIGGSYPGFETYDPTIRPGQWAHIVITHRFPYQTGNGNQYSYEVYVNGQTDGAIWIVSPFNNSKPFIIGGRGTGLSSVLSHYFVGRVDEVALYNYVMTTAQITNHYNAAFVASPAQFGIQPSSQSAVVGDNVTFLTKVVGANPITLQWKKNGVNLASQTNSTLTVNNVYFTDASDAYSVAITNAFGFAISTNVFINVSAVPSYANLTNNLVLHLTFDGNYSDTSGHGNNASAPDGSNPSFVPGIIGSKAVYLSTDAANSIYNYLTLDGSDSSPDFMFGSDVNFSVSYWVQITNEYASDLPALCSAVNSTGGYGITLDPSFGGGNWCWTLEDSTAGNPFVQGAVDYVGDGKWHNLVHTFNRSGYGTTYLDGQVVNATPIIGFGDIDSGNPFNIGQDPTGGYNGGDAAAFAIDDLGLWRQELSSEQARSIYIAGLNGESFDTVGPVKVSIVKLSGGNIGLSWQSGSLLSSGSVTGPWTTVPGATPPYYPVPVASTNVFYKAGP